MRWSLIEPRLHLKRGRWSLFYLLLLYHGLFAQLPGTRQDYADLFGRDYTFAAETLEKNSWWSDTLAAHGIDPVFALSVVFPELIRYSSMSDYIEIKALEVLYVQYGHEYADFSVGLFQMKPSFAEQIEEDVMQYHLTGRFPSLGLLNPDTAGDSQIRKERIARLQNEYGQLLYLEAFLRIMDHIYRDVEFENPESRLVFYSTAFNTGYRKSEEVIRWESGQVYFYRGMTCTEVKHSYSDIAVEYYKKRMPGKNEKPARSQ
ncbi:MAG: hypothetical protein MUC31_04475 [Bacteroidales bacterium]|jgi:hypothetical protein|nr:hypothetical protein [Bacteroidales bacterium]